MKSEAHPANELSSAAQSLLELLLNEALQGNGGVDAKRFRAVHFDQVELIDSLVEIGHIRQLDKRYHLACSGLAPLATPSARAVLNNIERLYGQLRRHYLNNQEQAVNVDALAHEAEIPLNEALLALPFMLECGLWCSGWSTDLSKPDAFVQPSEGVLKYPSFESILSQVRTWRAQRPMAINGSADNLPTMGVNANDLSDALRAASKPDWLSSLKPEYVALMNEVYAGIEGNLRALPVMGIRAAIDMVLVEMVGDVGGFEQKLSRMVDAKHLTDSSRNNMLAAIDACNATAHRGYVPDSHDLQSLLGMCESLLQEHFVKPAQVQRLRQNTPPRPAKGRR